MKNTSLLSIAALTAFASFQPAKAAVVPSQHHLFQATTPTQDHRTLSQVKGKRHLFPEATPKAQDYRSTRVIRDNKYNVFTLLSKLPIELQYHIGTFLNHGHDCDTSIGLPGSIHRNLQTINNCLIRQIHSTPKSSIVVGEGYQGDFHFYDTNTGKTETITNPNLISLEQSPLKISFEDYAWRNSTKTAITIENDTQNERVVYSHRKTNPWDPEMHITDKLICCYPTLSRFVFRTINPKKLAALNVIRQQIEESEDLEISIGQKRAVWHHVPPAMKAHLLKKGLVKVEPRKPSQTVLKGTGTPTILKGQEKRGTKRVRPFGENPFTH